MRVVGPAALDYLNVSVGEHSPEPGVAAALFLKIHRHFERKGAILVRRDPKFRDLGLIADITLNKAVEKAGFPSRDIHIPDTVAAEPPGSLGLRLPRILRQGIPIIDEHGQVMANFDLDIIPALCIPCRNNLSVRSHVVGELQLLSERFPTFEIVEYKRHQHQ